MKASLLYRIAAVLLVLFAVAHTFGFQHTDPKMGIDAVNSMRSVHFDADGFDRTYWDFFLGAGFAVGVLYLFTAVVAWQLAGLPASTLAQFRITAWALALCFAAITVLSIRHLFLLPIIFSAVVTVVLIAAAWVSGRPQ